MTKKLEWLHFHLSTAVVGVVVAGLVLYVNTISRLGYVRWPSIVYGPGIKAFCGFPFAAIVIRHTDNDYILDWAYLFVDAGCAITAWLAVLFIFELIVRRSKAIAV